MNTFFCFQLEFVQPISHSASANQSVSNPAVNQQQSMSQSANSPALVQGVYEAICDYTAKKGDEIRYYFLLLLLSNIICIYASRKVF